VARLSVYVSRKLKADITAVGRAVNWSKAVRPALRAALVAHRQKERERRAKAGKERR
jgi:hypothetical protein